MVINSNGKKRDTYVQLLRGIAIILVILIHSKTGMECSGYEKYYWIVLRQMINFAVPLFFAISGYFVYRKNTEKSNGGGYKWIRRLLIPYLIWTAIYTIINGIDKITLMGIISKILFGMSSLQMYFIIVLIELTLIAPLLNKAVNSKKWKWIPLLCSPLYYFVLYYFFFKNGEVHYALGRNLFPWLSFYYLGMLLSAGEIKSTKLKGFTLVVIGFIASLIEAFIFEIKYHNSEMAVTQLKVSSFVFSIGMIILLEYWHQQHVDMKEDGFIKQLIEIGNISYGIYYLHPIIIRLENAVCRRVGLYDIALPIYEIGQCLLTIIICSFVIWVVKKADLSNKWRWVIGF